MSWLNNAVLFDWAAAKEYRHWVFVPAGVKLVLAMVFRWRGALGVMLGTCPLLQIDLPMLNLAQIATLAVALGFAPLLATMLFSRWTGLAMPWFGLGRHHLPLLVLLSASLCALSLYGLLVAYGVKDWHQVPSAITVRMIGDLLGAVLLMLTVVGVRRLMGVGAPPH